VHFIVAKVTHLHSQGVADFFVQENGLRSKNEPFVKARPDYAMASESTHGK
jgi:hypothetical protein